ILTRDISNPVVVLQGGNQQSRGVELALNVPVTDQLDIGFSGALLEAEYGELIVGGGADQSGKLPQNVPEKLADLVVTYTPTSLPLRIIGSARYNGGFFTSNANTVKINSFTTMDAAVAWDTKMGTVTLRGRNLTDEFYADW